MLFALSLTLVALVAISVAGGPNALFFAIIVSAGLATAAVRWLFPEGLFFSLTLANLIAVYASIFAFFTEEIAPPSRAANQLTACNSLTRGEKCGAVG